MEIEQLIKRLDWLDDERRKDKVTISTLEERIKTLEAQNTVLTQENKEISSQVTRTASMVSRFDQVDAALGQMRVELNRSIDAVDRQRIDQAREMEKQHRADQEVVNKNIGDLRKSLEGIAELKRNMQARIEEEIRISHAVDELSNLVNENQRSGEESRRIQKISDESRRQDTKRIMDLQGEVATVRKRQDEMRGKLDVASDSLRKMEVRLNEILAAETERRQAQNAFMERQSLQVMERERLWKEWQDKFDNYSKQTITLDSQLQAIDATHRAVKRSQEAFDEITQKYERRINEITEMQRLVEERFRQEWVTFKADDQKRWTNFTLAQDEQQRETSRQHEKQNQRLVVLEDLSQELKDILNQTNEETQKRLQDMLPVVQSWIDDFENFLGRNHES